MFRVSFARAPFNPPSTLMSNIPSYSQDEAKRLDALRKLKLLDSPPSEAFDRMTRTVAELFKLPIAAVSLTDSDRQWFKSRVGVTHDTIPRLKAPCAQVTDESEMLVIRDLLADSYYKDSPLARSGIRFYAGAPLITHDGFCLGALCVLGTTPREVTSSECNALRDLAAMVMAQIELQHALGRVDPVSGLPNRTQFIEDFRDMGLDGPVGHSRLAALVSLGSPDQLGYTLQSMGPSYLDELVADAVRMLAKTTIAGRIYHVAPAEFIFIAPTGTEEIEFCTHLENWLRQRTALLASRIITTARIGVLPFQVGLTHYEDLLRNLHSAVQHALEQDRGVSMFSAKQAAVYQRRFWLINEFSVALDCAAPSRASQLRLVYQPKVELASGACIGAEALLRWTHPEVGDISPAEFIPLIEKTNSIRAVTNWVLEAALHQLSVWRVAGHDLQLAVNVSSVNLAELDFCVRVVDGLQRHGLPPDSLALEITESALMQQPKVAHAMLNALSAAGVSLAIDDFGTGYSSLAYLHSLPAQVVKIDQSFVRDIDRDERKRALFTAMIRLSHELGHRVVAEGVETLEVARLVHSAGCDEAQGYLYARPMPPDAFEKWFVERREQVQVTV
jgi:EAL domain-containing protein (putative c-di-GMP-specific phosphodiesterase class I)/GAF domain-containing protein